MTLSRPPFELALTAITVEWVSRKRRFPVRLNRVLYAAWEPGRLNKCRTKLAHGMIAPAVKLVGFKLGRETWYSVSDGMHRCAARAEAGMVYINAEVGGHYVCDPKAFVLWRDDVWRRRPDGGLEWICEPSPEAVPELLRIGVPKV